MATEKTTDPSENRSQQPSNKQLKHHRSWQCKRCSWFNDLKVQSCENCRAIRRDILSHLRGNNPYVQTTTQANVGTQRIPPNIGTIYNPTINPTKPPSYPNTIFASYPSMVYNNSNKKSSSMTIHLPSLNHTKYSAPIQETFDNLHPSIKSALDGSSAEFTNAVMMIDKNKDTPNGPIIWTVDNILGADDWLQVKCDQFFDNYGKTINDKDIDRLYHGIQRYILEYPKGPFQGASFWKTISTFTNSSRKSGSWKTHFNNIVKDENKGTYRWSQLNALKIVVSRKRAAKSVNNEMAAINSWREAEVTKKESAKVKKETEQKQRATQDSKLTKLLDLAIIKETNSNSLEQLHQLKNQNVQDKKNYDESKIEKKAIKDAEPDNKFQSIKSKYNTEYQNALDELKGMIDDTEDDEIFDENNLDDFKKVLFLSGYANERDVVIKEFMRLDVKYYGDSEKIIKKLLKLHKYFNK